MKTIICGSRALTAKGYDFKIIDTAVKMSGFKITEVIHGDCRGPDRWSGTWAWQNNIPVRKFPAQWIVNGKQDLSAGFKRNIEMAKEAQACIAILAVNSKSHGTRHMIATAKQHKLQLYIFEID